MRTTRGVVALAVLALWGAACSATPEASPPPAAPAVTTTTLDLPDRPAMPLDFETEHRTWLTPDGEEWALDLAYPVDSTDGGWPVLVTFHGAEVGTSLRYLDHLAAEGIVVVGPRWADPAWTLSNLSAMGSASDYAAGLGYDTAPCALAAAQAAATEVGGDPARTTVEGLSAGVHPAAEVGLGIDPGPMQLDLDLACREVEVVTPIGMVIGDAQWLFEAEMFDEAFEMPFSAARESVDGFIDPTRWNASDDLVSYLWSTDDWVRANRSAGIATVMDRDVVPYPADSWLTYRSEDWTSLGRDLETSGAFDDGLIGFSDNGRLQALRIESAGIPVLYEDVTGVDHDYTPEVFERILDVVWREGFAAEG